MRRMITFERSTRPDSRGGWRGETLSFDAAADLMIKAHAHDGDVEDIPVSDLRNWAIVPLGEDWGIQALAPGSRPRKLRHTGFSGLCQRFGVPSEFMRDRLGAKLQVAALNFVMAQHEEAVPGKLRCRGDEVTAIVSERYEALDQAELMQTMREALVKFDYIDKARVEAVATGMVDVVRFTMPASEKPIRVGDVSMMGFDMRTSSFGQSSVAFHGLVYRLVCTNGMTRSDTERKQSLRHVGKDLKARVAERLPMAVAEAAGMFQRWERSVAAMVDDVGSLIAGLSDHLTVGEQRAVSKELTDGLGLKMLPEAAPAYDVLNAITATAREHAPARRIEIERVAGDLLRRLVPEA